MQVNGYTPTISGFSNRLKQTYHWFETNFLDTINSSIKEFWGSDSNAKLLALSENSNILSENDEFFVTQIRLNKELAVFIRLSKDLVRNLLEKTLGKNGRSFDLEKITELEAKILTEFNNFLYKKFHGILKKDEDLPLNNVNYNECTLSFFLKDQNDLLGKIVIKIPVVAIKPELTNTTQGNFDILDFASTIVSVNIIAGTTKIKLNDIKTLEEDDIVLLDNSNINKMIVKYDNVKCEMNVIPNPIIMLDNDENFDENGGKYMPEHDTCNMWDSIQVEIGAEFEKFNLSLGELKQISEGLVVDIGGIYNNKIDLKVAEKIVASGELVIINDRYGVRINKIYTDEKPTQIDDFSEIQNIQEEVYVENNYPEEDENNYERDELYQAEENSQQESEEDFDYSNFNIDDDEI